MTTEILTNIYWLLTSAAIVGLIIGFGCWYGLKQLPQEED